MIKRTIDVASPAVLRIQLDQLIIARDGFPEATVPVEDIGILLIDQQIATYTHAVLVRLAEAGTCVILCNEKHLPCAVQLPLAANDLLTERLLRQIEVGRPKKKRLWQQVVRAKIAAQAANLESPAIRNADSGRLRNLIAEVASGDSTNVEGQAAQIYWAALLGDQFRRQRSGQWPNAILNYGYAVMRAAVARALAGAGLHPALGIHHHNRGNPFCLADDLLEPLRPMVDAAACGLISADRTDDEPAVTPAAKRVMLGLLARHVHLADQSGPLMVQLHRMAASLWGCYTGEREALDLPTYDIADLLTPPPNADD